MILLHRKSIIDCCSDCDWIVHEKEVKSILHKIDTMDNYYCFVLALTESWENGQAGKIVKMDTQYCNLHDIIPLYLDGNTVGYEFGVDGGDLMLMSYQGKVGDQSYTRKTVAISMIIKDGYKKYHHEIDHEFIELCAKYNPRLFKYL